MIIEAIVNLISGLVKIVSSIFDGLPDAPEALVNAVNYLFDMLFSNLDFISFFVNVGTLKSVATIAIIIWTLDHGYSFVMWIIHKIPLSID